MNTDDIRDLIKEGKLQEAIEKSSNQIGNLEFENLIIELSAAYHRIKRNTISGVLLPEMEALGYNKITNGLLTILSDIDTQKKLRKRKNNSRPLNNLNRNQFLSFIDYHTNYVRKELLFELSKMFFARKAKNMTNEEIIFEQMIEYNLLQKLMSLRNEAEKIGLTYMGTPITKIFDEYFTELDYKEAVRKVERFLSKETENYIENLNWIENFIKYRQEELKTLLRKKLKN